jgi:DNA polymerase III sliding clamp (beta) subunit (PCNA family)
MVHKYKPVVATSKIILHTNTMNALLIRDVLSMMKEPDDLFQLECDIDETDFNIYVKITGGLALLCLNEHEYDDIVSVLPPTTNISVDDILYKIALRKQYVIQQHLALIHKQQRSIHLYSSSATTLVSRPKKETKTSRHYRAHTTQRRERR